MNAATGLSLPMLIAALRKGARTHGDWDRVAAIELLIQHESWLHRRDFRRFVSVRGDGTAWLDLRGLVVWVDEAQASSSEGAVLRLACSLAGAIPSETSGAARDEWSLRSMLRRLGPVNAARAAEAVRFAALGPAPAGGER